MIARFVVLLLPFVLICIAAVAGGRALPLGRLPGALLGAGLLSAADLPSVRRATRRLKSARFLGALGGLFVFAVPVFFVRGSWSVNLIALLAGFVLGATLGQWWVGRTPRQSRRTAPLARRRLVDLIGRTPLVLLAVASASAVVADAAWIAMRPSGSRFHTLPGGGTCVTPAVSSVSHHLLSWAVIAPILLFSVAGALIILRRAVDPTVPASADAALRAAAIRTVLGGGMLIMGGHALITGLQTGLVTSMCSPSGSGWSGAAWASVVALAMVGTTFVLYWCVAVYVLAPARRPAPVAVPVTPEAVAVS